MAGRMVCTKEVSEELPSDLIEILHRCHAQMQLELAQWFNQSVPSDQATPSVCKADEYGCPETRISKSPNISKSVGDADEDFEKERVEPVRMSSRFSKNGSFCRGGSSTQQESAPRKSRWLHNDEVQLENLRKRGNGGESSDLRKERRPKRAHNIFRRCIENPWFDRFFAFMIIASSVAVGAEVEYSAQQLSNELPAIFTVLQISFFSAFLIELCIRMLAFRGSFFTSFDAGWNIFDTSVVFFSAVEVVVAYVFADNSFLTIVRTIRVVRFARIIRVVRFLRQLRVMVYTLFGTFPSLFWSMILMSIIMYLFSTMITQAVAEFLMLNQGTAEDQSRMRQVFGSTARTAYFLFQSVSGGTNWARDVELLFNLEIIYATQTALCEDG
ncbi:unnamed protein product [Effrenium voratum]|uniref:Ion transport domain-containing protein n=1 Tax=Effrenium voratum TaxID=2562239 RepID=A0AA36I9K6_9DINO|nr:unnamed protein product [Effrenium voratum]